MVSWKEGGCHCGAVRFKVRDPLSKARDCNCSICTKKGFLHVIVRRENFELLAGESSLSVYQFLSQTAKHYFCKQCGIAPFYIPRSHPDGYDVNLRCVDDVDLAKVRIEPFDGQNWEASKHRIEGFDS